MNRFVIIVLSLLVSATAVEAADKVWLSISAFDGSFLTSGVALKHGMFKDEGLDVELIRMNAQ